MQYDGVTLELRRPKDGSYTHLINIVSDVSDAFNTRAFVVIERIFEDNKNCAIYDIELSREIPQGTLARDFAKTLVHIFRRRGGYNEITIHHRGEKIRYEDPWWAEHIPGFPANDF